MRTLRILAALLAILIIVVLSFASGFVIHQWLLNHGDNPAAWLITRGARPSSEESSHFKVFWEAWHILERDFYGTLPDDQQMTYAAVRGVLSTLEDPNTVLVEPKPRELEKADLKGEFGGIGAYVSMDADGVVVLTPIPDTPADRIGILAGDILIKVDDTELTPEMSIDDVVLMIRGPIGTTVRLTVRREGQAEPLVFEIERAKIETPTVSWHMIEDVPDLGYIRITLFSERTAGELEGAIEDLKSQGAGRLILDLRNNGGGLLDAAIDVASEFLPDGIVLYEDRRGQDEKFYSVRGKAHAADVPLVVLVNGGTASASEIVAGAIQDTGRGVLIGEQTFGKGSVQLVYDLSDGSSLHVTVAHWFTPRHHEINGTGLSPDVEVPLTAEDHEQGRDPQLERAIEYLKQQP